MTERALLLRELVQSLSDEEKRYVLALLHDLQPVHPLETKWNVSAETILTAIERSSDLTQRGVRGVIAEAVFQEAIVPTVPNWECVPVLGDKPYDFLFNAGQLVARIQVKLQRLKEGRPMLAVEGTRRYSRDMYTVEVQKTRGGKGRKKEDKGEDTRPYRFGEFDILAVNLHPSTGDWKDFLFTVANWLVPREEDPKLVAKFQPVPKSPTEYWTSDLNECLEWYRSGKSGLIFDASSAKDKSDS